MRAIHWFRNDLRLRDNTALCEAARAADELLPLYVLDERLLDPERSGAPRVRFLLDSLERLDSDLRERGNPLVVRRGDPREIVPRLLEQTRAERLYFNRDTTPYARRRDARVHAAAERRGAEVLAAKDRVVFQAGEIRTQAGESYGVFSPYKRAWYRRYEEAAPSVRSAPRLPGPIPEVSGEPLPDAVALGFGGDETELPTGGEAAARRRLSTFLGQRIGDYARDRNLPAVDGTSRLSPYLRFGAISIRDCVAKAREAGAADARAARGVATWVDELVWREFYAMILEEHPRVQRESYREEYESLAWNDDEEGFRAWCEGHTGYPLVDAGMRQLASIGWMHNRARMITASFLTKDLLVDWRHGERFFFQRLVDGDPGSNNGGWQWSASCGTDAAPYFRIFNPVTQGRRFDPDGDYVRRWVPELAEVEDRYLQAPWEAPQPPRDYPPPILDHAERRGIALERFAEAKGGRA